MPQEEIVDLLNTNLQKGLEILEVKHRQQQFGLNVITPGKGKGPLLRFLLQFNNPLVIILLIASVVTILLKDTTDAMVIFGVVLINAIIGFIQESRAEEAISALSKTMTTEANAIRSGKTVRIPAAELVPGDIVQLQAGMSVPADVRLMSSRDLQVTEAALTGESLPVKKNADVLLPHDTVLADRINIAYASTLVTYGTAHGVVVATGDKSEVGRISQLISGAAELRTPLTKKISHFSLILLIAILVLSALTVLIGLLRGQALIDTLMTAIALAVSAIPEGLPATLTVILAIGVARMARRHAIIRNLPAVETLGSTTVICSDKTGTLTQNQMTVKEVFTRDGMYSVAGTGYYPVGEIRSIDDRGPAYQDNMALLETLKCGLFCNDSLLEEKEGQWYVHGDPTEGALLVSARKALQISDADKFPARIDAIPFDSQHQYMATLHSDGSIYIKGAAEVLLDRCSEILDKSGGATPGDMNIFRNVVDRMASGGMRVLAFARLEKPGARSIAFDDISGLTILGLQGMIDPPREEAVTSIKACHQAGINVKMITGDHALTAAAIGRQIGLADEQDKEVLTGYELSGMSDADLSEKIEAVNIFARVAPEQKLRLVEILQSRNHIVAMTGDGVNDAPALKQANIGVSMGITGTDVAKESADMILTDDNFASIEAAVEEGRGVYDNLIKFIAWTLPTNLGEGLVLLAAIVTGATLPILPIQILWINMITAAVLGVSLSLEPKEDNLMQRKPRDAKAPILSGILIWRILLVSVIILAGAFGLFEYELSIGASMEEARTVAVNVVIFVELFYLFNARSTDRSIFRLGFFSNPWAVGGAVLMTVIQLIYTYIPFMNGIFGSAPISPIMWVDVLAISLIAFLVVELEKWLRRKKSGQILPVNS
ncbi:MAG: cation-transporting P-type ATPase [Bacteroidales bacterium]|nr:cation-transporting P-type ATPase [Bacteroidales bacterium]